MLIYLDMCCLKRPFDDQSQPRVRLETEAVLSILAAESDRFRIVRSTALMLENEANPIPERAARVGHWLGERPRFALGTAVDLEPRVGELCRAGLKAYDALHVATAEQAGADRFVTVDDRLLNALRRSSTLTGRLRACSLIELAEEVHP